MDASTAVGIIIQARSTSKRFPGKIFAKIGNKEILQLVVDACSNSSHYINARKHIHGISCQLCIAIPYNDEIANRYSGYYLVQGPEDDVLTRYVMAADKMKCDYIVRITSDCPVIPPFLISKAINLAITHKLDYVTNCDPDFRTSPDGHDVQVVSKRLLQWVNENAKTVSYREHVLSILANEFPPWGTRANIIGHADFSSLKFSIDTKEDLERMQKEHESLYKKVNSSIRTFRV